jgi:tetratricopeptide (TPR) repeat protein
MLSQPSAQRIACAIIIALLSFIAFSNTLNNDFIWDDQKVLLENENIRSLDGSHLKDFFTSSEAYNFAKGQNYRPIALLSFAIIYKTLGPGPSGFHLVNVLIHTLNSVLVFFLVYLVLTTTATKDSAPRVEGENEPISIFTAYLLPAFITGLLFATHPIHTEAVGWCKQLEDLLALFFMLSTFYLYIKSRAKAKASQSTVTVYYVLSIFFFVIALFSKEMAVTLPLILLVYDLTLGDEFEIGKKGKGTYDLQFFLHHLIRYIPYWLLTVLYLVARTLVLKQVAEDEFLIVGGIALTGIPKFFAIVKGIAYYIKLLVFPVNLSADYLTFPVSLSIDWQVVLSLSVLTTIFVAAAVLYKYSRVVTFSILWFFITLLPVSNIINLRILIAERFLYIPSLGFCLFVALGLVWIYKSCPEGEKIVIVALIAIVTFYTVGTIQRNRVWKSGYTFWSNVIEKYPDNARARYNMGAAYFNRKQFKKSINEYQEAINLDPNFLEAHYRAGDVYERLERYDDAINEYRLVLAIGPDSPVVHNDLGLLLYKRGEYDEAISHYKRALMKNPNSSDAHFNLANVYRKKGLTEKAIHEYKEVLKRDDKHFSANNNLGILYAMKGRNQEAVERFKKAIEISPDNKEARYNIGLAYTMMGDCNSARTELREYLVEGAGDVRLRQFMEKCGGGL